MSDDASGLKRDLGLLEATTIIMGSMIGSGIFLAPALIAAIIVAEDLGPGTFVLIWAIGGLLTLCGALSYGELAAAFPRTGGQYVFLKEAFSPFPAFLYGWTIFLVVQTGLIAAVAVAFANYLGVFIPWVSQSNRLLAAGHFSFSSAQLVALVLIVFLTWINTRGVKEGAWVQNVLTIAKVGALAGLILAGIFTSKGSWSNFQPWLPSAVTGGVLAAFAVAMSKALFAYDAWNTVTFVAEETRDPVKTLPKALFMGTVGVAILYTLANVAYLHVLPVDAAAAVPDQRIAAEVAQVVFGPIGVSLIAAAILISTFGCDNGLVLAGPRLYYAMAKDGLFLKGATRLDAQRGTPVRSLWYQALWSILLVLTGSLGARGAQLYSDLLTFTSFASLLFNALTVAGLFVLRVKQPNLARPFRVPAYPWIPALYLAVSAFFLVFIAVGDPRNAGLGFLVMLAGVPVYFFLKRRERARVSPVPAA
ncbi:MAG: APC family permease [Vicinamibacteria bacterium]